MLLLCELCCRVYMIMPLICCPVLCIKHLALNSHLHDPKAYAPLISSAVTNIACNYNFQSALNVSVATGL